MATKKRAGTIRAIGARELKTRLGTYLRVVRQGHSIIVTDRGEPVAELRPVAVAARGVEAQLERLVTLGLLSRTGRGPLPPFKPIRHAGRPLSDTIAANRRDRF